jgi:hypothetical protein
MSIVNNEYWHEAVNWTPEKSPKYQEFKRYGHIPPQCFHSDFIKGLEYIEDWQNGMGILLEETDMLKEWQGIYFCCREVNHFFPELSEIWYIGKSLNFRQRWRNHHKFQALKSIKFISIYFLRLEGWSESDISKLERRYIDLFKPVFNDATPVLNTKEVDLPTYQQGFKDGCEKARQAASDYYSQEIAKLHAKIVELQG